MTSTPSSEERIPLSKLNFPKFHYRSNERLVGKFPEDRLLFVYDGVCVLCSGGAKMVAKRDKFDRVRFVSGQSELGKEFFKHYGLPSTEFTAQLVIADGEAFTGFDGFAETIRRLPISWLHLGRLLRYLPFKEKIYSWLARNRYRVFGRRSNCMIPPVELKKRFIA
ncbi:thiol-disulfide oxidoreductase DCC family protein [Paracoccus saliphilus]|uniref:DUF393 domain-containing protein n=1 Tax=Paracoccus saliphilus TaxID=405559 RepID=A0AA45W2S5_9RHOB|nr:DCC1-like thiol-disulfide oxidoreductase family protein [Paracoccus saliphilus]WCR01391.1 DUF393 domain-containing protein [Paracoccus saliphilus]SIS70102.1 Predicted thiol-disulfide oxidoreductase YuxK, DCC family [Paracoccus saliphilus]